MGSEVLPTTMASVEQALSRAGHQLRSVAAPARGPTPSGTGTEVAP
ncbi:hypothetical protein SAMN04487843_115101 [Methylobacterium sp. ap11]|nr:hypothetical protein SAMN04487843_115101 [Methylobacterium sp. ap11]